MISRANSKHWILRRLKAFRLPPATLVKFWAAEGRIHFEMSSALWHGALSVAQSRSLEKVQRLALGTISSWSLTYKEQLENLGLERLDLRRTKLSITFAKRTALKSRHQDQFSPAPNVHNTRGTGRDYIEPKARTTAYRMSAVPALTRLLNARD